VVPSVTTAIDSAAATTAAAAAGSHWRTKIAAAVLVAAFGLTGAVVSAAPPADFESVPAAGDVLGRVAAARRDAGDLAAAGHYAEAAARYREAIAAGDGHVDVRTSAGLRGELAAVLVCSRQFREAAAVLDAALAAVDGAAGATGDGAGDGRLRATLLTNRGDLRSAQVAAGRARARFADDPEAELKAGDELQAAVLADYDRAAALAAAAGDPLAAARASANGAVSATRAVRDSSGLPADAGDDQAAAAERRRQAVADAAARTAAAATAVDALADSAAKARLLTVVGRTAQDVAAASVDPASRAAAVRTSAATLGKAADLYRTAGDGLGESYATGYLGGLYERYAPDRPADALTLTRRAAFLAQAARRPQSAYRWEWQRGRLLAAAGDRDGAVAAFDRSVEALKGVRSDLALGYGNGDGRLSFRDEVGPVYFGLADLLLRRAADPARSADQRRADLVEARDTVELLKSGELEDYFRDPCVNQLQAPRQIDDVGLRTAVVYVVPLPDRLELLVNISSGGPTASSPTGAASARPAGGSAPGAGLRQFTVTAANDKTLAEAVARFRRGLQRRGTFAFKADARLLYKWLIDPIEPALQAAGVDTLVFVPDGALRTIPMAALSDGEHYLVERYAVAVTPGLRLMRPEPIARGRTQALLAGLSVDTTIPGETTAYPGLPNVGDEIAQVAKAIGDTTTLMNEQFVPERLTRELYGRPYSIVHLATHGEFRGDAADTFVLMYGRKLTLDQLQALIAPAQFKQDRQGQAVELLTLSACRTAAGDDRAALGLAGVAIKAGARSAVASLWYVKDEAAARLVADFYAELRRDPTQSKAQALRKAQIKLLADPDDVFTHPVNWAPFIVIGNWL
jgi:CHAT domain-containing protein